MQRCKLPKRKDHELVFLGIVRWQAFRLENRLKEGADIFPLAAALGSGRGDEYITLPEIAARGGGCASGGGHSKDRGGGDEYMLHALLLIGLKNVS